MPTTTHIAPVKKLARLQRMAYLKPLPFSMYKNAWQYMLFLFCLIYSLQLCGQPTTLRFKNISIANGLSQNSVMDIVQDKTGFMWLATQNGINRYDGKQFVVYKETFDDITTATYNHTGKLLCDNSNNLWIITGGGKLKRMDMHSHKITAIDSLFYQSKKVAIPALNCFANGKDGSMWLGTRNGEIICFSPSQQKIIDKYPLSGGSANPCINSLHFGKGDNIWAASSGGLFFINTLARKIKAFNSGALKNTACSYITIDQNSTIWLGTFTQGLFAKTRQDSAFKHIPVIGKENIASMSVQSIATDADNNVWIATYGNGVYVWDHMQSNTKHFAYNNIWPQPLCYDDILCLAKDTKGDIWIGTDGGGISIYDKNINYFNLISNSTYPLIAQARSIAAAKNGDLLEGTYNSGLNVFSSDGAGYKNLQVFALNGVSNICKRVTALYTDPAGDIWMGSHNNGLFILNSHYTPIKHYLNTATSPPIFAILPTANNNVWIGTRGSGLMLVNKGIGVISSYDTATIASMPENDILSLAKIDERIIAVGFGKKGVHLFNTETKQYSPVLTDSVQRLFTGETLSKCLLYQAPFLWIGTNNNGIIKVNISTKQIGLYNERNYLPDNTVYGLLADSLGGIWGSTNKGLFYLNTASQPVKNLVFGIEDGLQSNEFNTGAYYTSPDSRFYFGGINGINSFNPKVQPYNSLPAKIVITEILANNQPLATDTSYELKKSYYLDHRHQSVSFNFVALDFAVSSKYRYYFQLEGYDKDWIQSGTRNFATYTNLPAGNYRFKIKAINPGSGMVSQHSIQLNIKPVFWRTWWFLLLVLLTAATIVYAFIRNRIAQLQLSKQLAQEKFEQEKKEAEFKRKVAEIELSAIRGQMNPHFIFNCLNSIKLYTEQNNSKAASDYVTKFSQLVRLVLENSRSERITLAKELQALELYIQMEAMRFKEKLKYKIIIEPHLDTEYIKIPPLLLQPYIENAIWHGLMHKEEGGTLTLEINRDKVSDAVIATITDNGIGRKKAMELNSKSATRHKSFGMKLTQDRITLINQMYKTNTVVEITDLYDTLENATGTSVQLKIQV
jgi:ligand-binding sensor domain-containing protein